MRLTLWLLGTEVLTISTDRADPTAPATEGDVEISRHSGDFQIGFTPTYRPPFQLGDIEAQHPRGATP